MKPLRETLRETEPGSPLLERAKALLEAAPPLPESQARRLRVRRALDQPRGPWVRLSRLPAAALAALVVLFGASAFAAVRVLVAVQSAAEEAPRRAPAGVATPAPAPAPSPTPAPTPTASASATPTPTPTPASTAPDGEAPRGAGAVRHAHRAAISTPAHAAHDTSPEALARATDSELVHRAAKALRSEHDPALAARLLEAHRARSPSGPLAEEALSLQVEALHALRSPRAAALAREYLARYPGGRYAAVATRALADAAP